MSEVLENKEVQKIYIDARGPRFSATITTVVLSIGLVSHNVWLLVAQGLFFLIGATKGPQFTPYGFIFKKVIRPRLKKEAPTEDVRPPKFAQSVGFIFAFVAILGVVVDRSLIFAAATSFALAAAFLNAVFNYCLGCQMYLLIRRFTTK
ncbi:MAG: DUF4395 domain-containing protein [Candidatus Planktophila sp.]|tara:strand:+ start:3215 stop:3661 length:447 start_codon:yes stop_codon:yes gene_type:complete